MKQIVSPIDFAARIAAIDGVINRQVELPQQVFRREVAMFHVCEFYDLWANAQFERLKTLAETIGDTELVVAVLKPDPIEYYYKHFGKYPLFTFGKEDTGADFIAAINEDPGDSPADAIIHNSVVIVVHSESCRWLLYGDRDFEIALIASADFDAASAVQSSLGAERLFSMTGAIEQLLSVVYRGVVPIDIRNALLSNYARPSHRTRGD